MISKEVFNKENRNLFYYAVIGILCIIIPQIYSIVSGWKTLPGYATLIYLITSIIVSVLVIISALKSSDKIGFLKKGMLISLALYVAALLSQLGYFDWYHMANPNMSWAERITRWRETADMSIWGGVTALWMHKRPLSLLAGRIPYNGKILVLFNGLAFIPLGITITAYNQKIVRAAIWTIITILLIALTEFFQPLLGIGYFDLSSIWLRILGLLVGLVVGLVTACFCRKNKKG